MKARLNKGLIEGIIRQNNEEYTRSIDQLVRNLLGTSIEDLSHKNAFVSLENVVLEPVNELLTGGFTENSKFVYFLGIDNAQIELNTIKNKEIWKHIKERIIYAWKNRNPKKKRRKKNKYEAPKPNRDFDPAKYNLSNLSTDLQYTAAKYLSVTSLIYNENGKLRIIGKDDFGSNTQIIIIPTIFDGEKFKYFIDHKKGFIDVDLFARKEALAKKFEKAGNLLVNLVKIFNVLYFEANSSMPNQIFVESLLCACPDNLFSEDPYKAFVKVLNYLTMTDLKQIKSIANPDKTIATDALCGNCVYGFRKMSNKLLDLQ